MTLPTKDLTIGALGCGISVFFLYLCSAFPTGKLSLAFIAAVVPCVLCVECNFKRTAVLSGISSGILAALLLPKQGLSGIIIVFYCACFSYYPALKALIESQKNLAAEWTMKLIYFFAVSLIMKFITDKLGIPVYSIFISAAALIAYDILLSIVIGYYIRVISPRIRKSRTS
ncbi:MAG: hypothetical protein J6N52_02340 [Clostridia bacterium]|nr:hypothetical protein [Clostridia bacterium]